jgi:hypothetical protein
MTSEENNAAQLHPQVVKSPDYRTIYVNNVRAGFSSVDMQLVFSRTIELSDNSPAIEDLVTVVMTPEEGRVVADILLRTIAEFARVNGAVRENAALAKFSSSEP